MELQGLEICRIPPWGDRPWLCNDDSYSNIMKYRLALVKTWYVIYELFQNIIKIVRYDYVVENATKSYVVITISAVSITKTFLFSS